MQVSRLTHYKQTNRPTDYYTRGRPRAPRVTTRSTIPKPGQAAQAIPFKLNLLEITIQDTSTSLELQKYGINCRQI